MYAWKPNEALSVASRSKIVMQQEKEKIKNDNPPLCKNYTLQPPIEELLYYTNDELKKIPNFKVMNEFGEITFLEHVDLRGLDLD